MLDRNVTITSLSPEAVAAAAAAGDPVDPDIAAGAAAAAARSPFWINCAFLNGRFQLTKGHSLVLSNVVLLNCRTTSTAGFVSKQHGSTIIFNNTVDQHSSVCLPLQMAKEAAVQRLEPQQPSSAAANTAGQGITVAAAGSNWCAAAVAGVNNSALPIQPLLTVNHSSYNICQQGALLIANAAWNEAPVPYALHNSQQTEDQLERWPLTVVVTQYAVLCAEPVAMDCIQANGTGAWSLERGGAAMHLHPIAHQVIFDNYKYASKVVGIKLYIRTCDHCSAWSGQERMPEFHLTQHTGASVYCMCLLGWPVKTMSAT
jgi:hypothetical protein